MGDPVPSLRNDYALRQEAAMATAHARQRRNRRNGMIAGAFIGLLSVALTAGVTRRALFWHSFLLESLLCAVAGYLLARGNGGGLRGVLLFSGAYLLAFGLRATGLDPSVLFAHGDLRHAAAIQGNFMSLCLVLGCGCAIGKAIEG